MARFTICPPLLCWERKAPGGHALCGARAYWMRLAPGDNLVGYFCPDHTLSGDQPIPRAPVFQRLRISVDVMFAGMASSPQVAQAEAVARLERAIEAAGGVPNFLGVTSATGRYEPPWPFLHGRRARDGA